VAATIIFAAVVRELEGKEKYLENCKVARVGLRGVRDYACYEGKEERLWGMVVGILGLDI